VRYVSSNPLTLTLFRLGGREPKTEAPSLDGRDYLWRLSTESLRIPSGRCLEVLPDDHGHVVGLVAGYLVRPPAARPFGHRTLREPGDERGDGQGLPPRQERRGHGGPRIHILGVSQEPLDGRIVKVAAHVVKVHPAGIALLTQTMAIQTAP